MEHTHIKNIRTIDNIKEKISLDQLEIALNAI
jgi:hypothetical protein